MSPCSFHCISSSDIYYIWWSCSWVWSTIASNVVRCNIGDRLDVEVSFLLELDDISESCTYPIITWISDTIADSWISISGYQYKPKRERLRYVVPADSSCTNIVCAEATARRLARLRITWFFMVADNILRQKTMFWVRMRLFVMNWQGMAYRWINIISAINLEPWSRTEATHPSGTAAASTIPPHSTWSSKSSRLRKNAPIELAVRQPKFSLLD